MARDNVLEMKELIKRYSETFVRAKPANKKDVEWEPVDFLGGTVEGPDEAVITLASLLPKSKHFGGGGKKYLWSQVEFDLTYPKSGVYPCHHYGSFPLLLTKNAVRQWKWGLCRGNTSISNIFSIGHPWRGMAGFMSKNFHIKPKTDKAKYIQYGEMNFDAPIAKDILTFEPTDYPAAIKSMAAGEEALVVIDNEYFLSVHPQHDGILLWRWDTPLGIILNPDGGQEDIKVKVIAELFAQEVKDFYSRRGIYNVVLQRD